MDEKKGLKSMVNTVADWRKKVEEVTLRAESLWKDVKTSSLYVSYLEVKSLQDQMKQDLDMHEDTLRSAAVSEYQATGNKKPVEGVEIKVTKSLEYSVDKITDWVRNNAPKLLVLDKKNFEKTAEVLGAPVEIITTPKAYLSSSIGKS